MEYGIADFFFFFFFLKSDLTFGARALLKIIDGSARGEEKGTCAVPFVDSSFDLLQVVFASRRGRTEDDVGIGVLGLLATLAVPHLVEIVETPERVVIQIRGSLAYNPSVARVRLSWATKKPLNVCQS